MISSSTPGREVRRHDEVLEHREEGEDAELVRAHHEPAERLEHRLEDHRPGHERATGEVARSSARPAWRTYLTVVMRRPGSTEVTRSKRRNLTRRPPRRGRRPGPRCPRRGPRRRRPSRPRGDGRARSRALRPWRASQTRARRPRRRRPPAGVRAPWRAPRRRRRRPARRRARGAPSASSTPVALDEQQRDVGRRAAGLGERGEDGALDRVRRRARADVGERSNAKPAPVTNANGASAARPRRRLEFERRARPRPRRASSRARPRSRARSERADAHLIGDARRDRGRERRRDGLRLRRRPPRGRPRRPRTTGRGCRPGRRGRPPSGRAPTLLSISRGQWGWIARKPAAKKRARSNAPVAVAGGDDGGRERGGLRVDHGRAPTKRPMASRASVPSFASSWARRDARSSSRPWGVATRVGPSSAAASGGGQTAPRRASPKADASKPAHGRDRAAALDEGAERRRRGPRRARSRPRRPTTATRSAATARATPPGRGRGTRSARRSRTSSRGRPRGRSFRRHVGHVVEVALGVGDLVVDRREHDPRGHALPGEDRLDGAGGADRVAEHRLVRRDRHRPCAVAEHPLDRAGLGGVVRRRRGAVGVHVLDVVGRRGPRRRARAAWRGWRPSPRGGRP